MGTVMLTLGEVRGGVRLRDGPGLGEPDSEKLTHSMEELCEPGGISDAEYGGKDLPKYKVPPATSSHASE